MIRCSRVLDEGDHAAEPEDTITLDEVGRHRRRMQLESDGGLRFLLDMPDAVHLRDGDRLLLDDERVVVVRAAEESLIEVRGSDAGHLLQLAWHLGNRHLPTEIMADHVRIRHDPVILDMLGLLGATVSIIEAGFHPEGGAYGRADRNDAQHGHEPHVHSHAEGDR